MPNVNEEYLSACKDYARVVKVIVSVENPQQLETASKMVENYHKKHPVQGEIDRAYLIFRIQIKFQEVEFK